MLKYNEFINEAATGNKDFPEGINIEPEDAVEIQTMLLDYGVRSLIRKDRKMIMCTGKGTHKRALMLLGKSKFKFSA